MALNKRTYVDQETVITAQNLNEIQDAIIANEEAIEDQGDDIGNLQDAVGDGALDSDFTATDLTGAANELKDDVRSVRNTLSLLDDEIPDTVQTITFDQDGNVQRITHSRNNTAVRTDVFTFTDAAITEVRTLGTGQSLTIVTDLITLQSVITYAAS